VSISICLPSLSGNRDRKKTKRERKTTSSETGPLMEMPVEEIIAELPKPDIPMLNSKLAGLSNLDPTGLRLLERAWEAMTAGQRWEIIARLVELAEDNFDLNYDSIFKGRLKDPDARVRCAAIEGLWENEETSLIEPLINLMAHDPAEEVRAAAAKDLGKFALLAELEKVRVGLKDRITGALLGAINDHSQPLEVRRRALESAAPLSMPRVREAIAQAYGSGNRLYKISAVFAMGKNCDPVWLPVLSKEMASADSALRYEAATAAGDLGEKDAVPRLARLIADPDLEVQLAAIKALGKIGAPEAKGPLEACRANPDETVREAAEAALDELAAGENPISFKH
jgi:HEAT repeat protein